MILKKAFILNTLSKLFRHYNNDLIIKLVWAKVAKNFC